MVNNLKFFAIIFFSLVGLQSCKKDDVYHNLNDEAKGLLKFNLDESFKLKNFATNEIITLTVKVKEFKYSKDGSNESSFVSFGAVPGDTYIERGSCQFADVTNCYKGEIAVLANRKGGFSFRVALCGGSYGCFGENSYNYEYQNEFFQTLNIEGIEYQNVYLLRSFPNILYYSKEKGILKIIDGFDNKILFVFAE